MRALYLILLIIVLMFTKCKRNNDNVQYSYYETGEVKEKIVSSLEEPSMVHAFLYSKEGDLLKEISYKDGVYHGVCKSYFEDGKIKQKANFINGYKNGKLYTYYSNGNVKMSRTFWNDTIHGVTVVYNEKGQIKEEYLYIKGEPVVHKKFYSSEDGSFVKIENHERNEGGDFFKNGQLVINKINNLPEKEMSLYYMIRTNKDTIKLNEPLEFELEIINRYEWNAKFISSDEKLEYTGNNNVIKFKIVPEKKGYNLLLGKLFIDLDTQKENAHYEFTVYKEFYVD